MAFNGVLWQTTHSGKMKGINSIGTSCANNPHCINRRKRGDSVCAHCYAATYMKMRNALKERLEDNANIMSKRLLEEHEIPVITDAIFRFESFGDLYNETHFENYIKICNKNPNTKFALYTKNVWILRQVFNNRGVEKPKNLSIVVSSPLLNKETSLYDDETPFVDHVFTVYDKNYIAKNNININCGAKSCLGCQICYHTDTEFHVSEKLK
jgi:hypothetical protein